MLDDVKHRPTRPLALDDVILETALTMALKVREAVQSELNAAYNDRLAQETAILHDIKLELAYLRQELRQFRAETPRVTHSAERPHRRERKGVDPDTFKVEYGRFMRGDVFAADVDREKGWSHGTASHYFADWARKRGELGLYRQRAYKNKSVAARRRFDVKGT